MFLVSHVLELLAVSSLLSLRLRGDVTARHAGVFFPLLFFLMRLCEKPLLATANVRGERAKIMNIITRRT